MMVETFANFRFVSVLRTAAFSLFLVACVLPTSAQPQDSDEINIVLPDGGSVALQPFIHHHKAGLSDAQCGVVIDEQVLTLIGSDETEAYSCVRLVEAGPLPPLHTGRSRAGSVTTSGVHRTRRHSRGLWGPRHHGSAYHSAGSGPGLVLVTGTRTRNRDEGQHARCLRGNPRRDGK